MELPDDLLSAIDQTRARVHLRLPWWLRPFLMRGVVGLTLGRSVYMAAGSLHAGADRLREELEALLWHELAHVAQINRLGLLRFYWRYAGEYVRHRRAGLPAAEAYRNISFEQQALAAERARGMLDV